MTIRTFKFVTLIAAATMTLGGSAAAGTGSPSAMAGTSAGSSTPATTRGPAIKADTKRYCVRDTVTGSRLVKTICRTRKEWLDTGFDPLAPRD